MIYLFFVPIEKSFQRSKSLENRKSAMHIFNGVKIMKNHSIQGSMCKNGSFLYFMSTKFQGLSYEYARFED